MRIIPPEPKGFYYSTGTWSKAIPVSDCKTELIEDWLAVKDALEIRSILYRCFYAVKDWFKKSGNLHSFTNNTRNEYLPEDWYGWEDSWGFIDDACIGNPVQAIEFRLQDDEDYVLQFRFDQNLQAHVWLHNETQRRISYMSPKRLRSMAAGFKPGTFVPLWVEELTIILLSDRFG